MGPRKGNLNKCLLKTQAKWIFRLGPRSPYGPNEVLSSNKQSGIIEHDRVSEGPLYSRKLGTKMFA